MPDNCLRFVGESEGALRQTFAEASQNAPCLVVFDEVDTLCPRRDQAGSEAQRRVVSTMLALLDGIDAQEQVGRVVGTFCTVVRLILLIYRLVGSTKWLVSSLLIVWLICSFEWLLCLFTSVVIAFGKVANSFGRVVVSPGRNDQFVRSVVAVGIVFTLIHLHSLVRGHRQAALVLE